ncbi:hypothetical protein AVU38_gp105 [Ralstonia phage RSL2]|uniref:Uncharacterized protein n=1 Tax=Ralstonia phage RSL2 TaxID=1585840 RepID=A0A0A8J9B6_9CAUD|nr:hypothetical protein AVU38_gp105 [Ralstonia phage RSL2]BAQ02633.1 hypothetical protein [Ralstonia phage RSL2]
MKTPITYAKAQVFRPGFGLAEHSKIQQHIDVLVQEPDYKNKKVSVVIAKRDLTRLFGPDHPREFYISANGFLTYIALNTETGLEGEDRFCTAIALNGTVLSAIFGGHDEVWVNEDNMPWLRFIVLANEFELAETAVEERIVKIEADEYKQTVPMFKWTADQNVWIPNTDPIEAEPEPTKPKIHLKDIPLNTRASRRMVRQAIEQHRETLEQAHVRSGSSLSFDEWMVQNQHVNIVALQQMEGIDNLPDDEYVDAMVKFKQAEVTGYHNVAVQKKETDLHLFDWCLQNFGEEFQHVGRKDAQAEIDMMAIDPEVEDDQGIEDEPAVFVVSFDGTIVEDQRPSTIGPESPFAIETLKALKKNGHHIFIFSGRTGDDRYAMLDFLKNADFVPTGTVKCLMPDDVLTREEAETCAGVSSEIEEWLDSPEGMPIDYFIDHKFFGAEMVKISGKGPATLFWTPLVDQLRGEGYLTDEDVEHIQNALTEKAQSL